MAKQVTLHLWGDSHLLPRHHVPGIIKEKTGKHYVRYRRVTINHAQFGQKMTIKYAKEMIDFIKKNDPEPMLHVLQIGSNNVWDKPTDETIDEVRALVADVANKILISKGSALVVTSPIPGDKPAAAAAFEKLHQELKEELKKAGHNKKVSYADFLSRFTKPDKDGSRFDPKLWEDHHHLNRDGAARFASSIMDHIRTLPIAIFGLRKASKMSASEKGRRGGLATGPAAQRGGPRQVGLRGPLS